MIDFIHKWLHWNDPFVWFWLAAAFILFAYMVKRK